MPAILVGLPRQPGSGPGMICLLCAEVHKSRLRLERVPLWWCPHVVRFLTGAANFCTRGACLKGMRFSWRQSGQNTRYDVRPFDAGEAEVEPGMVVSQ